MPRGSLQRSRLLHRAWLAQVPGERLSPPDDRELKARRQDCGPEAGAPEDGSVSHTFRAARGC